MTAPKKLRILIRGGGDLASGVALRLHRAGWDVLICELPAPLTVRRLVSFSEAVYANRCRVEEVDGVRVSNPVETLAELSRGNIPVIVDPGARAMEWFAPDVLIDGRMLKTAPELAHPAAMLSIGLGPGFVAGGNCHAVIETKRGPFLGRVIWNGSAEPDSGLPEKVASFTGERVLRADADGIFISAASIGTHVDAGDVIGWIGASAVRAPFSGVIRGLVHDGLTVSQKLKIGDVDPRDDPLISRLVSDKSLAIGGAVLEAILSFGPLRGFW